MIKAIIFDLDGTILNTIETITYYCNKALETHGFNTATTNEYKYFAGNGAKLLIERAMRYTREYTDEEYQSVFALYNKLYDSDTLYLTSPFEGITELLESLHKKGIKTAVLSNKPDFATSDVVGKVFGKEAFDYVRGGIEGVPLKPDPTAVFDIMKELNVSPEEVIFVGDTNIDIATGKNAGLYTIGVLWGFREREELEKAGADVITDSVEEILKIAVDF